MFQITVSVDRDNADWLYSVEDVIKNKLESFGVCAVYESGRRVYCCFGCENENRVRLVSAVKECLTELFAVVVKFDYIKQNLSLALPQLRYEILLRTLVAFDRENEHKILDSAVDVSDGLALDGLFNFKLTELKERWTEICALTKSNCAYLHDDDTFNELLRFLISAVNPKIKKLTVCERDGNYRLTGNFKSGPLELNARDSLELMYYLIDLAPLEVEIDGILSNGELKRRLIGIFDAKLCNNCKNKTKK